MKLVIAHNWYRSSVPSGANIAVEREVRMLQDGGISPWLLYRHSDDLAKAGVAAKLRAALSLHAGKDRVAELRRLLADTGATILHAHNVWPLLTYGLFEAAKEIGMKTVQTLHNNRLVASRTHFYSPSGARRARTKEEREHLHRLIVERPNAVTDWLYARAYAQYWRRQVPLRCVDRYICLTNFQKQLLISAGIPEPKLAVKPNFIEHDGPIGAGPGDYALYVGRLTPEKGVEELCRAWLATKLPLKLIGGGPLAGRLPRAGHIEFLGRQSSADVMRYMAQARFLIMNSNCYETFGLVLVEALASGTPCLVPRLGGMPEIVAEGRCGLAFTPGDGADLVGKAQDLWQLAPGLRPACRSEFEARYTAKANFSTLTGLYGSISSE